MTEYGFHHLPVRADERPAGMLGLRQAARQARARMIKRWLLPLARPAEPFLGDPWSAAENAAPAHGRLQHVRASRERVDGRGCALAFEEEDDLALADEDVVPLEPHALEVKGRPLPDEPPSRLGRAPPDRDNDGNARARRVLGPEPSEQIGELAQQPYPAEGGDEHTLAGTPLEDEGLLAVDPITGSPPNPGGRELVERNPEPLRFSRSLQDELVGAEFEPTARGRALAGAPDDGVIVRTLADALGGHAFPLRSDRVAKALARAGSQASAKARSLCAGKY
jgi:hypothetical protein